MIIKKYPNRKLYCLALGGYTNLSELVKVLRHGGDFTVLDTDGVDVTKQTLAEALVLFNDRTTADALKKALY